MKGLETWEGIENLYICNACKLASVEDSRLPRSLKFLSIRGASSLKGLADMSWDYLEELILKESALEVLGNVKFSDDLTLSLQDTPLGHRYSIKKKRKWKN